MVDMRVRKLTPEFMSYTIAKMGLWALTRTAAQALTPAIRVNAIGPGPTMQGHRQSEDHFQAQRANTVLERGANPSDITAALGYFLDAHAVTGQLVVCGWRAASGMANAGCSGRGIDNSAASFAPLSFLCYLRICYKNVFFFIYLPCA